MKEILYIQAGNLSNYTGTHFWNTQECYLPSDSADSDLQDGFIQADPSISFCESIDSQGRSTMCPRVLIFDVKERFGTLSISNALGQDNDVSLQNTWFGSAVEHRQELIPRSQYHVQLGDEESIPSNVDQGPGEIRYWSDYSRVYFLPRSLQMIPEVDLNWPEEQEIFSRFNEESELIDGPLRLFVEDCDNMQGIQVMNDTSSFCGFMNGFLTCFRDEYSKIPSIIFPVATLGAQDLHLAVDDVRESKRFLIEAFYLRNLNELSSMSIPVEDPMFWPDLVWNEPLCWPKNNIYHQSAVLSACIESATLPFRSPLAHVHGDMASICEQLKYHNNIPFGMLSGTFPVRSTFAGRSIINFSSSVSTKFPDIHARLDITRGFSAQLIQEYEQWLSQSSSPTTTYVKSIHSVPYPLPTSFPPFLGSDVTTSPSPSPQEKYRETPMFSSISTSSAIANRFERYAIFVDGCIKRQSRTARLMGFTSDDMLELANDLRGIVDNMAADGASELAV